MTRTVFFPALLAIVALLVMPHAAAHSAGSRGECAAQGKAIKAGQADVTELKAERDELAEQVEAAGDEWEAAEATRLFGKMEAAKADAAGEEYEGLKVELVKAENALQERVSAFNAAVETYNARCAAGN